MKCMNSKPSLAALRFFGSVAAGLALFKMRKDKKSLSFRLEKEKYEDPVTGGANEEKFIQEAKRILKSPDWRNYAVVSFHLERFCMINELFGYSNGTKVLKGIHWVLAKHFDKNELCAHVYGDRFLLLVKGQNREALSARIKMIREDLKNTIEFYGIHYEMVPIFGVCECSVLEKPDPYELINCANVAMKNKGTDENQSGIFYGEQIKIRQMTLKNMVDRLDSALENHEFVVYYQPKYCVSGEKLFGAEALVRWRTDPETLVSPGEFIPVFEKSDKIGELDRYVFHRVCQDIQTWLSRGKAVVPVSVNLSRVNLRDPSIADQYRGDAAKVGVPLNLLELEVTESAFVEDGAALNQALKKLNDAGFALSIDDFGSDYSALKMLQSVPAHTLKLDRAFFNDFNERSRVIVSAVVRLAKTLQMDVIAEGIETKEQLDFLKTIQCSAVQGYYFSPPISQEKYSELLPLQEETVPLG